MSEEMINRFQKSRWSETRKKMFDMKPGQKKILPIREYFNAHSTAMRLSDADELRCWKVSRINGIVTAECLTPTTDRE